MPVDAVSEIVAPPQPEGHEQNGSTLSGRRSRMGTWDVGATFRSPAGGLKASPTFRGLDVHMSVYFLNDHKAAAWSNQDLAGRS